MDNRFDYYGSRFDPDVYTYGSMRDFKHRETLKDADWGYESSMCEKIGSSMVFVCFMAIVLFSLLIVF